MSSSASSPTKRKQKGSRSHSDSSNSSPRHRKGSRRSPKGTQGKRRSRSSRDRHRSGSRRRWSRSPPRNSWNRPMRGAGRHGPFRGPPPSGAPRTAQMLISNLPVTFSNQDLASDVEGFLKKRCQIRGVLDVKPFCQQGKVIVTFENPFSMEYALKEVHELDFSGNIVSCSPHFPQRGRPPNAPWPANSYSSSQGRGRGAARPQHQDQREKLQEDSKEGNDHLESSQTKKGPVHNVNISSRELDIRACADLASCTEVRHLRLAQVAGPGNAPGREAFRQALGVALSPQCMSLSLTAVDVPEGSFQGQRGVAPGVRVVELNRCRITVADFNGLIDSIHGGELQSFEVAYCGPLEPTQVDCLAPLTQFETLHILKLSGALASTGSSAVFFLDVLPKFPALAFLNLDYCNLESAEVVGLLCRGVRKLQIESLSLRNCNVTAEGASELLKWVAFDASALEVLDLRDNRITSLHPDEVAFAVHHNPAISVLRLNGTERTKPLNNLLLRELWKRRGWSQASHPHMSAERRKLIRVAVQCVLKCLCQATGKIAQFANPVSFQSFFEGIPGSISDFAYLLDFKDCGVQISLSSTVSPYQDA